MKESTQWIMGLGLIAALGGTIWWFQGRHAADFEFGDDSYQGANNGTCDDPRFTGNGMSMMPSISAMGRDASDCRDWFFKARNRRLGGGKAGVGYNDLFKHPGLTGGAIVYGSDTSSRALDGLCQDARFQTADMVVVRMSSDIGGDATDCRTAVETGRAQWIGDPVGRDIDIALPEGEKGTLGSSTLTQDLLEEARKEREAREAQASAN